MSVPQVAGTEQSRNITKTFCSWFLGSVRCERRAGGGVYAEGSAGGGILFLLSGNYVGGLEACPRVRVDLKPALACGWTRSLPSRVAANFHKPATHFYSQNNINRVWAGPFNREISARLGLRCPLTAQPVSSALKSSAEVPIDPAIVVLVVVPFLGGGPLPTFASAIHLLETGATDLPFGDITGSLSQLRIVKQTRHSVDRALKSQDDASFGTGAGHALPE